MGLSISKLLAGLFGKSEMREYAMLELVKRGRISVLTTLNLLTR